jgi:hypothetical protein
MRIIVALLICFSAQGFETFGKTWPQREITYRCEGPEALKDACRKAAKAWNKTGVVTLTEGDSGAAIVIKFSTMEYGYLAYSMVSLKERWITGGVVTINEAHKFRGWRAYDLPSLVAHEIGHCLGLGHSSDRRSIMYSHAEFQKRLRLGADDIAGIKALYAPWTAETAMSLRRRPQFVMPSTQH